MRRLIACLAALLFTGCFQPDYREGLPCGPESWCPDGLTCTSQDVCRASDDGVTPDPGDDGGAGESPVTSIVVAPDPVTLFIGDWETLTATAVHADGSEEDVTEEATWASSAPAIARVQDARVTAVAVGDASITAQLDGHIDSAAIAVLDPVISVTVAPGSVEIALGLPAVLVATAHLENGDAVDVTATAEWSSDDPAVAVVEAGVLSGVSPGSTTVHASVDGIGAAAGVTITPAERTGLTLDPADFAVRLQISQSRRLHVAATWTDGHTTDESANAGMTWAIETGATALSIAAGGVVTGVAPGAATVAASLVDGGATLHVTSTTLTVYAPRPTLAATSADGAIGFFEPSSMGLVTTGFLSLESPGATAWADYDGDGDLDLAVARRLRPDVLYRNDGGDFVNVWASAESDFTYALAWGDYDGDGDPDLATGGDIVPARVYRNDGGSFTDAWDAPVDPATLRILEVLWVDVELDGDLDLLVHAQATDGTHDRLVEYRNDDGLLVEGWTLDFATEMYRVVPGDVDGDGDLDFAAVTLAGVSVYRNDGGAVTAVPWTAYLLSASSAVWGDVDGDGDLDLVVGTSNGSSDLSVYPNEGGELGDAWVIPAAEGEDKLESALLWWDANADGELDLMTLGFGDNAIYLADEGAFLAGWSLTGSWMGLSAGMR